MKLVFTLTAGRTGAAFLAELLARSFPFAEVHHERLGWVAFLKLETLASFPSNPIRQICRKQI
jgi:hypothetical protein